MAELWHYFDSKRAIYTKTDRQILPGSVGQSGLSLVICGAVSASGCGESDFAERVDCVLFQAVNDMEVSFRHFQGGVSQQA